MDGNTRGHWARSALRWLLCGVAAVAVLLLGYGGAGWVGGLVPANGEWREPEQGIRIYVEDNGIHTGIVLPVRAAGVDWSGLVRGEDLRDPRFAGHGWRSFGWGDRDFYLNTPTWAELRPGRVLKAAIGSRDTLMHVDFIPEPAEGPNVRAIVLRPEEYHRLAAFIRASFRTGADGRAARHPGYGNYDAFYAGTGTYSAIRTCNAWTGEAFRAAGVKMGIWTPFPSTVMKWL